MALSKKKLLMLTLVSGVCMGVAHVHAVFWCLGVIGLAIYFYVCTRTESPFQALWYGSLAGSVKTLIVGSWVWYVYPLSWMGDFSAAHQIAGIGWMWFTGSVAVGVSLGLCGMVIRALLYQRYMYVYIPILYVSAEILGSILFSIVQYGPGGSINAHTSFGYLGYTFGGHGLLSYGGVVLGVYGLSFLGASLAVWMQHQWAHASVRPFVYDAHIQRVCAMVLLLLVTHPLAIQGETQVLGLQVATINTQFENVRSISATEEAGRRRMLIEAFRVALTSGSDVVVFPETASALSVLGGSENVFTFIDSVSDADLLVVDSDRQVDAGGDTRVRALVYDTRTRQVASLYKKFLVPSGEFLPYHLGFVLQTLGFSDTHDALQASLTFVPQATQVESYDGPLPGILFCSESVSPTEARHEASNATLPLIVHPVSHAWLNEPYMFWHQLDYINRTQTRFAGVPLVQASNMWEPMAFDRFGRTIVGEEVYATASTSVVVYEI